MATPTATAKKLYKRILARFPKDELPGSVEIQARRLKINYSSVYNVATALGRESSSVVETPEDFVRLVMQLQRTLTFQTLADVLGEETTLGELASVEEHLGYGRNSK